MQAWLLRGAPGDYEWATVADPVPGPGQARVRVRASALNHMDHWLTTGWPRPNAWPHVPGNDVAGVVESLGPGVTGWSVGDEVVVNPALVPPEALAMGLDAVLHPRMEVVGEHVWGGHAELCVVDAHQLAAKPAGRTWAEAAAFPVGASTAWRLFRRAGLRQGQVVLVTGIGGGVATAAMMLALHHGAEVHVTSRDERKRQRALELGAAGAHDSGAPYPLEADIVLDSIGPATWEHVVRALRPGGKLCVCGATSGPEVQLHLPRLFWKQHDILGGSCASPAEFDQVAAMMAGGLPTVVDEVLPLSEYPRALERLRAGEQVGKIVLEHPR